MEFPGTDGYTSGIPALHSHVVFRPLPGFQFKNRNQFVNAKRLKGQRVVFDPAGWFGGSFECRCLGYVE